MQKILVSKIDDNLNKNEQFLLHYLESEKQERIKRYRQSADRQRSLLGGLLLKYLLFKECKIRNYRIYYNKTQKPYIENVTNCYFNISHSGQLVACALSSNEIGIDIEYISDQISLAEWAEIGKQLLSTQEQEEIIHTSADRMIKRYYYYLTQKESFAKCTGKGLEIFEHMRFTLTDDNILCYLGDNYYFTSFDIEKHYIMHVCAKGQDLKNSYEIITAKQLQDFMQHTIDSETHK